jgi:DUF1680 family protein
MKSIGKRIVVFGVVFASCSAISQHCIAQYVGQYRTEQHIAPVIKTAVEAFDLQNVKLLDSRFKENMDRDGRWLLQLDSKRLLHSWRLNAGIRSNARPLGGWEAITSELRGHTMGHVLSGLALMYASTGDDAYRKKGDSLVNALSECQQALHQGGYLSAFPVHFIDRAIDGTGVWAPWYTIHKVMAGLTDMYLYAQNKQALDMAEKMSDWAYHKLNGLSESQLAVMEKEEFGGMIEVSYNLYGITGNENDKKLAELFYHHAVLDPLAERQDKLAGLHANTQIPKIIGEARGYELTGNDKEKTMADFFWQTVIDHQTFPTGGNSDNEHFFTDDQLSKHLTPVSTETCNTYNMLKLTRHLFTWTADVKYADYYERALYNHILASQDTSSGMVTYFMAFKPGLFKTFSTPDESFWCCVGTGFENHAKYAESIYYHNEKGVYVNLFIPSELNWIQKGFQLRQDTRYPEENTINLTIDRNVSGIVPLYIRYPGWATNGATVRINHKAVKIDQKAGSYITLERNWKPGDKIEVTFPMSLRLVPLTDDPDKVAVAYGPIILAGDMGTAGISAPAPFAKDQWDFAGSAVPADVVTALDIKGKKINNWLKPVKNKALVFEADGVANREITMLPYYQVMRQRYVLYWDIK